MMKRVYILALLLLSVLVVPALSVSGEDGPVIIVIKDLGTKSNQPHRVPAKIPFECHLNPCMGDPLSFDLGVVDESEMLVHSNPRSGIHYIYQ